MQLLSATDAIGPAFTHARTVLVPRPFRMGRFFKLALVAALTQATYLSVSFTYPLQGAQFASRSRHVADQAFASPGGLAALGVIALLVVGLIFLLFMFVYLYLLCRLRVTLFDLVVNRGGRVRQAWRRQRRSGLRYCGVFALAMLCFWCVAAAIVGPAIYRLVHTSIANVGTAGGPPALGSMLPLAALVWLVMPVWVILDTLLQDFILPGLVVDQAAPLGAAFARLGRVFRQRPGQLVLFVILRTVVALGVGLALGLVTLVVVGAVGLASWGVGKLLYHPLWAGGIAGRSVFFAVVCGMALVVAALYLLGITAVYGVTGTFKASYAAYFFAGYYPELASVLDGQPPDDAQLVGIGPGDLPPPPPLKARPDLPPEVW